MADPVAPAATMTPRRFRRIALEVAETIVLTVVIFFGVQTFVVQPFQVEQFSMEPTLEPGQYVLVDKLTPRFEAYRPGDIIVFVPPTATAEGNEPFIKRIVAVGGDTVAIRDGAVFVNGDRLTEPYVFDQQPTGAPPNTSSWVVPAGDYFVLGDHRQVSDDSRDFGPISRTSIIGRAWLRYWPLGEFGTLP